MPRPLQILPGRRSWRNWPYWR